MVNPHSTQFDDLLWRAYRKFIEACGQDDNLEGEYAAIDMLAHGELRGDEEYNRQRDELEQEYAGDLRTFMFRDVSLMLEFLRRRGHLDAAPMPEDKDSMEFFSS